MVKISKIYTRTGDDGETGLVGGSRVVKDDLRVEAYGQIDELNSWIGAVRTELALVAAMPTIEVPDVPKVSEISNLIALVQNHLFDLGAELATPPEAEWPAMAHIGPEHTTILENQIDRCTASQPELRSFVLPGGSRLNSALHLSRTVCRRAERHVIAASREIPVSGGILIYLNRLSDLLFALARWSSLHLHNSTEPEYLWQPGEKPKVRL